MHDHDWATATFGELITEGLLEIGDGYRAKNSELGGAGLIFLRAGHVTDTGIDLEGASRFAEELAGRVASKTSRPGDVLVTTKGNSTGRVAFVSDDLPTVVYSPHLSYWRSLQPEQLVPGFLRAWSRGPELRHQIQALAHGTDMAPYFSLIDQRRLRITLPPLAAQRAIAHILGTLDDKIELNRQMNQTLEQIAAALFKSWFVDFDPVRAKASGSQPEGMDAETAALFPDRLVDGSVPEGWERLALTDLISVLSGGTPSTRNPSYWGGSVPWYSVVDAPSEGQVWVIDTERKITDLGLQNSAAQVLPIGTTVISARGTVGKLALTGVPMSMNQSCYGLVAKSAGASYFTYFTSQFLIRDLQQRSHGSVFDTITRSTLSSVEVTVPPQEVIAVFHQLVEPMILRILNNLRQIQSLASIRDTLLPRLLSGELRVPLDVLNEEAVLMTEHQPDERLVQSRF